MNKQNVIIAMALLSSAVSSIAVSREAAAEVAKPCEIISYCSVIGPKPGSTDKYDMTTLLDEKSFVAYTDSHLRKFSAKGCQANFDLNGKHYQAAVYSYPSHRQLFIHEMTYEGSAVSREPVAEAEVWADLDSVLGGSLILTASNFDFYFNCKITK